MRAFGLTGVVAVIGMGVSACGGTTSPDLTTGGPDSGGGGTGGATTAASACSSVAKARCQKRDACSDGVANKTAYGDEATCESREAASCETSLGAPGTGATPESVSACAAALPGTACADFAAGAVPDACNPATGSGADGSACAFNAQCASAHCAVPKDALCGTCAPAPKAGDSCAATGTCGKGLDCTKDTSICVAPLPAGGACAKDAPCAAGLSCVGATKTKTGTCQASGTTAGVACDPNQRTAPGCEKSVGLFCSAKSLKCEAITFAAPGQPCGAVGDGLTACTGGGVCVLPSATATAGTCAAPAADGAPCDVAKGGACLSPAKCIVPTGAASGTCKLPDATACH
jgi:hypothetical protein